MYCHWLFASWCTTAKSQQPRGRRGLWALSVTHVSSIKSSSKLNERESTVGLVLRLSPLRRLAKTLSRDPDNSHLDLPPRTFRHRYHYLKRKQLAQNINLGRQHYVRVNYKKYRLTLCKLNQLSGREPKTSVYTRMIIIVKTHHSRNVHITYYHLQVSDVHFRLLGPHQWSVCIINHDINLGLGIGLVSFFHV